MNKENKIDKFKAGIDLETFALVYNEKHDRLELGEFEVIPLKKPEKVGDDYCYNVILKPIKDEGTN